MSVFKNFGGAIRIRIAPPKECATLVLAGSAPHAGILVVVQGPLQANLGHVAGDAHRFGFFDLRQGRASIADREEQFGIYSQAGSSVTPIHTYSLI